MTVQADPLVTGVLGNPLFLRELPGNPASKADTGFVYTKDAATITELFYEDSAGNVTQLTSGGSVMGGDTAAQYLALATSATLTNERVFTPGTGISAADAGAGSTYTVSINQAFAPTWTGVHTFTEATSPIITAKLGPVAGQQHALPAVASDTIALLAATQTFTNKTLTAPVIADFTSAQHDHQDADDGGTLDHGLAITGLTDDDHTQYALLAGRAGGQVLIGGNAGGEGLDLKATSHGTDGAIRLFTDGSTERVKLYSTGVFVINGVGSAGEQFESYSGTSNGAGRFTNAGTSNTNSCVHLANANTSRGAGVAHYLMTTIRESSTVGQTNLILWELYNASSGGASYAAAGASIIDNTALAPKGAFVVWANDGAGLVEVARVTGAKKLGIGTTDPLATVDAIQPTLGSAIFRLSSTATNDDPTMSVYHGRVATTDATVTTIGTITPAASTTTFLEARVWARRTGGASGTAEDGAAYIFAGTFKNAAGTITQIGTTTAIATHESQAGWAADFTISGTDVLIQVTGAAGNNVTWHVEWALRAVAS